MAYDKVQFIGYAIDTSPKRVGDQTEYLGLDMPEDDIQARCQLMLRAIETARASLPAPPSEPDQVVKVFEAPEFYFRGRAAYPPADVDVAIALLQRMVADDQWTDWLLAFGTILGADRVEPTGGSELYNVLVIQEGGRAGQSPSGARVIMKAPKSDIDAIADAVQSSGLLVGEAVQSDPGPSGRGRDRQRVADDGAGVFTLHDITWAADICQGSHEGHRVAPPQLSGDRPVQIQLALSCGASFDDDRIIAQKGGYVFNVDGADGSRVDLMKVDDGAFNPMRTTVTVPDGDIHLHGSPPRSIPISALYRRGPGQVIIYAPVDIPQFVAAG